MITINFPFYLAATLPIWALYRLLVFLKNRRMNFAREILIGIFLAYLLGVVYLTFFSFGIRLYDLHTSINYIPVRKTISMIKSGIPILVFVNLAGNILLLSPIGVFLTMLFKKARSLKKVMYAGFLISISIEMTQLVTGARICDIDDVIFNTIGAILGYCFYLSVKKSSIRFSLIERLVEDDTQKNLLVLAVKPVIVVALLTLSLCAASFYQNTY